MSSEDSRVPHAELGLSFPREEWYSRGYLPHRDKIGLQQAITFRLADSLPQQKLRQLEDQLSRIPEEDRDLQRRLQIEEWLDAGIGCCVLGHPDVASVVEETLLPI